MNMMLLDQPSKPLSKFNEYVLESARAAFVGTGQHYAMVAATMPEGIALIPVADLGKNAAAIVLRKMSEMSEEVAYIDEAWIVSGDKDTPMPTSPIAEHPDRVEVLIVSWSCRTRCVAATARIERLPGAKPSLGEWQYLDSAADGATVEGRFANPYSKR